ncbi:hypothetical protein [Listeria booriae]|uniref:hypothetical protein n=1 Tax=Listeria booriae TaxID=1552123 RepID=UPI0016260176|nr:hypothetical protein [Listeria booriae]MBC2207431.1 hypothetical protein [Listeria booriae]
MQKRTQITLVDKVPIFSSEKRKEVYKAFWAHIRVLESEGWTLVSYSAAFHYRAELELIEEKEM